MYNLKAFAKVNIYLKVFKKKPFRKRHRIESIICKVEDLYDEIEISESESNEDIVFSSIVIENISLFKFALKILRKEKIISKFYNIKIKKNIPFYSGLGGLSSCVAEICKFFLKETGAIKTKRIIKKIFNYTGYDCYFFFYSVKCAKVGMYGQKVVENEKIYHVKKRNLFFPKIGCSTKKVYNSFNRNKMWKNNTDINMLTPAILLEYPDLVKVVDLEKYFFSGSGSTLVSKEVLKTHCKIINI